MIIPIQTAIDLQDEDEVILRRTNFGERLAARAEASTYDMDSVNAFSWARDAFEKDDSPVLKPEELNKKYPMPIPFSEEMSEQKAKRYFEHNQKLQRLESLASSGEGGVLEGLAQFGAGMAPHILDPIGIATSVAVSGGVTKLMSLAMKSGKQASMAYKLAKFGQAGAGKIARNSVEGAVGNVISESVFSIPQNIREHREVDVEERLGMAVLAGAAFPALLEGFKKIKGGVMGKFVDAPENVEKSLTLVEQQMAQGKQVDIDPLVTKFEADQVQKETLELEKLKQEDPQNPRVAELEEKLNTTEKIEVDRVEEAKKANSDEANTYHSKESVDEIKNFDETQKLDIEFEAKVADDIKAFDKTIAEIDAPDADPEFKSIFGEDIKQVKEAMDYAKNGMNVTKGNNIAEIVADAFKCVTGG
jgi:hypothetical protein